VGGVGNQCTAWTNPHEPRKRGFASRLRCDEDIVGAGCLEMNMKHLAALLCCALLSNCAVGPGFIRSTPPAATGYITPQAAVAEQRGSPSFNSTSSVTGVALYSRVDFCSSRRLMD
jgi:hypothetical protein